MSENEQSSYEKCVAGKIADGMSQEEAEAACKSSQAESEAEKAKEDKLTAQFWKDMDDMIKLAAKTRNPTLLDDYRFKINKLLVDRENAKRMKQEVKLREEFIEKDLQRQKTILKAAYEGKPARRVMYWEDFKKAMREYQLEEASSGKKSAIEGHIATEGYAEQPGTMPDLQKRVVDDLDKMIKANTTAPQGA
jgi:hypothetical protein